MRKRISSVLWGIIFIIIGIGIAGSMAGLWEIRPFFSGWWTLFLIVPAFISIIEKGIHVFNSLCLLLGAALMACCRGVMEWDVLYRLMVPVVFLVIGFVLIVRNLFHIGSRKVEVPSENKPEEIVTFSAKKLIFTEEFYGMDAEAYFGGLTLDLRNAVITENISIDVMAVFGGVDILLPSNVEVKLNDTAMFGGCSNHRNYRPVDGPVVYVNAVAMFGGVEVK